MTKIILSNSKKLNIVFSFVIISYTIISYLTLLILYISHIDTPGMVFYGLGKYFCDAVNFEARIQKSTVKFVAEN